VLGFDGYSSGYSTVVIPTPPQFLFFLKVVHTLVGRLHTSNPQVRVLKKPFVKTVGDSYPRIHFLNKQKFGENKKTYESRMP